jgi:hemerythrin-like domain-containing protein
MNEITTAMLKHHQIINKILLDFEKVDKKNTQKVSNLFSVFKWNLNKHLFIEEENIFPVADKSNPVEAKELNNFLKDHRDIKKVIESLDDDVMSGMKPNTMILREMLFSHEGREIKSFYPLLDKRLSLKDKLKILQNVKDVKLSQ